MPLLVIGRDTCGKCNDAKELFDKKGIFYEYRNLAEIDDQERRKYLNIVKETGQSRVDLPILIEEGEVVDKEDIINRN